jgi:tetratricopeptide (TPR) repeat protein
MIKLGLPGKAEELIRTLDTPEKQSSLLVRLSGLHIQLGDHTKADTLIREVEENTHPKFQGGPTLELVRILIKNRSMAAAEKYAIADQSAYAKTSLIETAGGYLKERQTEKAEALISKVLSDCSEAEGDCDYALFLTARAYYLTGRPDKAMRYAERIVAMNTRTQTLVEIAGSTPDESIALKVVEIARAKESQCTGENCRYIGMSIAQGYGAAGQADKALDYLNKHYSKDPIGRAIGLEKAVRQLARRGKVKDAKKLMSEQTTNSPSMDQMKQAIGVAELKNGDLESALSRVESIPNSYVQFQAAITLAKMRTEFSFIQKWLSKTRPEDRYIETYAGTTQVLLAAAARDGHTAEARNYIETIDSPLLKTRGLIGIAQGLLQKQPGEEWAQSLGLTW